MKILIKGAGDLASGIACRLHACAYDIVMTDLAIPTAVRRTVSFSRAIYEGQAEVEAITAKRCDAPKELEAILVSKQIAVMVDPQARIAKDWQPDVIVDAILAKKNLGTSMDDAPIVIAVGPGFTAGKDCHCVIESKRGHYLGRCIYEGSAIANTGVPGDIGGYTKERILRAPAAGILHPLVSIGDFVEKDQICAWIDSLSDDRENLSERKAFSSKGQRKEIIEGVPMRSQIRGIVRGLLQDGVQVHEGMKSGDVDPRCEKEHCFTVSDKARAIGGGVLEAILHLSLEREKKIRCSVRRDQKV